MLRKRVVGFMRDASHSCS